MKKSNPKVVIVAVIEKDGFILIGKRKQGKRNIGKMDNQDAGISNYLYLGGPPT